MYLIKLKWLDFQGDRYVRKAQKFPLGSMARILYYDLARKYYQDGLNLARDIRDRESKLKSWLRKWAK